MRKVESAGALLLEHFTFENQTVVDVGCGTGELVRWLTGQGARVTGVDTAAMLAKAESVVPKAGREAYLIGSAEKLPIEAGRVDIAIYFASLHHVAFERLGEAMRECARVLKPGGHAVFVEPVARPDSYYEITRLTGDEVEVQRHAYLAILGGRALGLVPVSEEHFYFERSFLDFEQIVATFVDDEAGRPEILAQARAITARRAFADKVPFDDYRYRSTCRMNLLGKNNRASLGIR
jgi:SAM-dependent methyltransferase